jgi:antitoxin component HigA of HigAB toxin-antitoxin module
MPTIRSPKSKDDHMSLIRKFPLKKIGSEKEHVHALGISGQLIGLVRKLSAGEDQYLDALAVLIQDYEASHVESNLPKATGIQVLRHLMSERQLSQRGFAEVLKISEAAASMILSGTRELTRTHIAKLSQFFNVGVAAFF